MIPLYLSTYQNYGGRCPPDPLGFFAWAEKSRGVKNTPPGTGFIRTDRRSGCVPAEPYPPTGSTNLSWSGPTHKHLI
jgi:hypothetical protein